MDILRECMFSKELYELELPDTYRCCRYLSLWGLRTHTIDTSHARDLTIVVVVKNDNHYKAFTI